MKRLAGKAMFYLNQGRGLVSLALSLGNTVGIWYVLLGFNRILTDILVFASIFVPVYLLSCTIIGYLYARRSPVYRGVVEAKVRLNPFFRDLARAIILLSEGKTNEAKEVLKKWA